MAGAAHTAVAVMTARATTQTVTSRSVYATPSSGWSFAARTSSGTKTAFSAPPSSSM